jgi:hypothetical protein
MSHRKKKRHGRTLGGTTSVRQRQIEEYDCWSTVIKVKRAEEKEEEEK